jgi:deoxyhypusine synthase
MKDVQRLGIFTIGGGVPRIWAQQIAPYLEVSANRLGQTERVRHDCYDVRICRSPNSNSARALEERGIRGFSQHQ